MNSKLPPGAAELFSDDPDIAQTQVEFFRLAAEGIPQPLTMIIVEQPTIPYNFATFLYNGDINDERREYLTILRDPTYDQNSEKYKKALKALSTDGALFGHELFPAAHNVIPRGCGIADVIAIRTRASIPLPDEP